MTICTTMVLLPLIFHRLPIIRLSANSQIKLNSKSTSIKTNQIQSKQIKSNQTNPNRNNKGKKPEDKPQKKTVTVKNEAEAKAAKADAEAAGKPMPDLVDENGNACTQQ
jgi:hypothetical protein